MLLSKKKTILQINTVVNYGSTGRIVEGIGQQILKKGWESYVAYGRSKGVSNSNLIKIGNQWDINTHVIKTRLLDMHGLGSDKATRKLIDQIKKLSPDIIHLHNTHGYYLNIQILFHYLATLKIPIVWTLHDCWIMTGHCTYFDFVDCQKWKSECNHCPQLHEYPSSFVLDRSKKNFILKKNLFTSVSNLTLVPVSKWMDKIIRQSFLNNYSSRVIYNGIDNSIFRYIESDFIQKNYNLEGKFIILGVASDWIKRKGLLDFIKLSHLIDVNTKIVLIGLTKDQLKKLPANIIGIQKTDSVQMLAKIYSSSDVYINPTWEDNFPTTNLEALACGLPVITYNTGGSPESIDSKTGFVVEKGDITGLLNAVETVKKNTKAAYSNACIARANTFYKQEDRYFDYSKLYEELLNE